MISLFWCIVLIKVVISDSEDSSSSSSSSSSSRTSDIRFLVDGEFRNDDGFGFSACAQENGIIYGTAGPITDNEITSYISLYARSIDGVYETSPGSDIFTSFWDVARFDSNEPSGVEQTTAFMTRDTTTNPHNFTIQFDGEPVFVVTQIDKKGERCLIPEANWNSMNNEVPFNVASDKLGSILCPSGASECINIQRYDDALASNGGVCWGYYDTDNEEFVGGGDLSMDVLILFDGELRSTKGNDENGIPPCHQGIQFEVWTGKEEITLSFQCTGTSFGAMWKNDILEESDVELACPLFTSSELGAKKISSQNVLDNDVNDYRVENIVINFSNTTIGNLWAILIVFILVTVIMCWFVNSKKKRGN